jgi:hypothetical protein
MSVLVYLAGGASIAVGTVAVVRYLLSLTDGRAWHTQLSRWARIHPAIGPHARRKAWNLFGIGLGLIVSGTLLVLSEANPALDRLTLGALVALLIWQLASSIALRARRRSAS